MLARADGREAVRQPLSPGLAVPLIFTYGLSALFSPESHKSAFASVSRGEGVEAPWPVAIAIAILIVVTVLVALVSEIFVGSVQVAVEAFGMTPAFVGFIVVALVGAAAEMTTAFSAAACDRLDLSVGIALGSAAQIALFVAPLLGKRCPDPTFLLNPQTGMRPVWRFAGEVSLEVHRERHMEAVGFEELLAAPAAKRQWSGEAKGRMVAETLVPGVTANEVARRHGVKANHLSSWRTLARKGKLVVPDVAGAEFAAPVATAQAVDTPVATVSIDLIVGQVTLRLDAATPDARVAELVMALRACP